MREMDKSKLITALLIALIIALPLFHPEYSEEEEITKTYHLEMPQIHLISPDVSFAFEVEGNRKQAKKIMDDLQGINDAIDGVEIQTQKVVYISLGNYYITGYTSIECGGSTMTASGATCHKAEYQDRLTEPTTCAIDPKLHDFGEIFYIPEFDTIYIAEDTGSAVKGKHLDLYFLDEEYSYALSITGNYEVYGVEIEYNTVDAGKYDITNLFWEVNDGET